MKPFLRFLRGSFSREGREGQEGSERELQSWRISLQAALGRVRVGFPEAERVVFGILADGEVAHLRHGGPGCADSAAEFFDPGRGLGHGGHADVLGDALFRLPARHQPAVGRSFGPARVDVLVFLRFRTLHAGEGRDFPAEQGVVELLRAVEVVGRDFKPDQASDRGVFLGHRCDTHVISFLFFDEECSRHGCIRGRLPGVRSWAERRDRNHFRNRKSKKFYLPGNRVICP